MLRLLCCFFIVVAVVALRTDDSLRQHHAATCFWSRKKQEDANGLLFFYAPYASSPRVHCAGTVRNDVALRFATLTVARKVVLCCGYCVVFFIVVAVARSSGFSRLLRWQKHRRFVVGQMKRTNATTKTKLILRTKTKSFSSVFFAIE